MTQTSSAALPAYYANSRPELTQLINPVGLHILEVGCAAGAMGAALLEKGAREVVGLDVFEPALAFARKRLTAVHRVDLNAFPELPFPEGHFDIITFADVLEHLIDPASVLKHLRRWLRDDGQILVSIPNVRHESVVLPLLVEGKWEYADWGILDRTHLRFFTRDGLLELLTAGGFALAGKLAGIQTGVPSYIEKAAELVKALGGDVRRFLDECNVIQFVAFARPKTRRATQHVAPPVARTAAPATPATVAPGTPPPDPWAGSRKSRVLFSPDLGAADECWATALAPIANSLRRNPEITLAIALPSEFLERPPAIVEALPDKHELDLLLTERPQTPRGWEALVRGATLLVLTSVQPELVDLAKRCGVNVHDARTGPLVCAAPNPDPADRAQPRL